MIQVGTKVRWYYHVPYNPDNKILMERICREGVVSRIDKCWPVPGVPSWMVGDWAVVECNQVDLRNILHLYLYSHYYIPVSRLEPIDDFTDWIKRVRSGKAPTWEGGSGSNNEDSV